MRRCFCKEDDDDDDEANLLLKLLSSTFFSSELGFDQLFTLSHHHSSRLLVKSYDWDVMRSNPGWTILHITLLKYCTNLFCVLYFVKTEYEEEPCQEVSLSTLPISLHIFPTLSVLTNSFMLHLFHLSFFNYVGAFNYLTLLVNLSNLSTVINL